MKMTDSNSKKKIVNIMVAWFVIIAALTALVIAQVQPSEAKEYMPEAEEYYYEDTPMTPEVVDEGIGSQAIQSLSFKEGTTISAALRMLALKYQKNIIPTERVEGVITVTDLFNVTFAEALQAIIGTNKFDMSDNFIMVYTPEEYEQLKADKRRMEYRIFTLYYISAEEAKKLLMPVVSEAGGIEATMAPVVGISSGDDLSVDEGGNSMSLNDSIVMKDYPENIAEAEALIKELDVQPLQVLVEATILNATVTEGLDLGVDISFMAGSNLLSGTSDTDTIVAQDNISRGSTGTSPIANVGNVPGTPIETVGFASAGMNGLRVGISTGDVRVFISALEQVTDVTVIANPKILALNKQVGTVFIGQNIGYRSSTTVSGSGVASSGEVKFMKSGTKLSFRPYIADDGYIRMDIYPKDSSATKQEDGTPLEFTAELTSNIMVKDGQTVVIGGLFRDSMTSSKSQVPFLGDIPVLGEVFKGVGDSVIRQEVIVLLTPHIIEAPSELEGEKRAEDVARKRMGARKGLHWIGVPRMAEESYSKAVAYYTDGDTCRALREVNWALNLRPTYVEAIRLRERIIIETSGDSSDTIERVMIHAIEKEDSQMWNRQ